MPRQCVHPWAAIVILCGILWPARSPGAEIVRAREEPVPMNSPYVPVRLDDYANDRQGVSFPSSRITVRGIPFDLVGKDGADNLFLRGVEWPDWKEDPSSYYSAYDGVPQQKDPRRPFFQIPVADYDCVYLLGATDNDGSLSPVVTFRIGAWGASAMTQVRRFDIPATVPRRSEKKGENVLQVLPGPQGNLFLLKIPIGIAMAQDFRNRLALDVELTKQLRLAIRRPDPCRFQYRPLGLPCGVHVYGMTFARSAVQMDVWTDEAGHVFNEPQTPTFRVALRGIQGMGLGRAAYVVEATATDLNGHATVAVGEPVSPLRLVPEARLALPIPVQRRGYYHLRLTLKAGDKPILSRETHFALLAPDTRRHRASAPWGTWDFGGTHFTPSSPDVVGPLYVKAGLRYGMFAHDEKVRAQYGVIRGNDPTVKNAEGVARLVKAQAQAGVGPPPRVMIFHEDAVSGAHVMRVPDLFTGWKAYPMNPQEEKRFQEMWTGAMEACREVRKQFPAAEIYFGNGNPQLLEEFLRRKFPRELMDTRGNEAGSFQRLPETQPPDAVANNSSLWMDRQILDHYGYKDVALRQCYEIGYPGSNPGNLALGTQAAYFVRHILHSMAWEIPIIRMGGIADVGNSYYYSNWGSSSFCFAQPDVSPKPAYVAVAVLTQVLDGAKFARVVPCAAPSVYALEFQGPDGGCITCLWTIRGKRPLTVQTLGTPDARLIDMMGNQTVLPGAGGQVRVEISDAPVYLLTRKPPGAIVPGETALEQAPQRNTALLSSLGSMADWTVESQRSLELELYDFNCPRRKGDFRYREVAQFAGQQGVLEVRPKLPVAGSVYLPMYSVLAHKTGIAIPGEPTEIGLLVNGNGGWGRIIFELEDASGQRWISIGDEQKGEPTRWMADWMPAEKFNSLKSSNLCDWNTDDAWGRSYINFEGWCYLRFPLPGNYPGEKYHWPYSSQWRHSGDGVVKYPLKFRKLVVTIPEKVLRFRDYAPVPRPEIYLKDLRVTYDSLRPGY